MLQKAGQPHAAFKVASALPHVPQAASQASRSQDTPAKALHDTSCTGSGGAQLRLPEPVGPDWLSLGMGNAAAAGAPA